MVHKIASSPVLNLIPKPDTWGGFTLWLAKAGNHKATS